MLSIAPMTQDVQFLLAEKDQIIDAQACQIKSLQTENARLKDTIAQQGLTYDAETTELSTPQTFTGTCRSTDTSTEGTYQKPRGSQDTSNVDYQRTEPVNCNAQRAGRTLTSLAFGLLELAITTSFQQEERTDRLYARIADMEGEKAYSRRLYKSKSLTGNEKLTLQAMREQILTLRVNPFEETQISLGDIAKKTGLSEWTARRTAKALTQYGLINKRNDAPVQGEDGQYHTHSFISLTEKAIDLDNIERPIEKQHGGPRLKCTSCGSENVKSHAIHICSDCGNVEFSAEAYEALSTVQNFHIENPLKQPNECMNDEKQDAFVLESTSISEPVAVIHSVDQETDAPTNELHHDEKHLAFESVAIALATIMESYKVKYNPHMTCSCGCQLWRTTMNDFLCARCEPSPIWPNKYNEALRTLYPGKHERKVHA